MQIAINVRKYCVDVFKTNYLFFVLFANKTQHYYNFYSQIFLQTILIICFYFNNIVEQNNNLLKIFAKNKFALLLLTKLEIKTNIYKLFNVSIIFTASVVVVIANALIFKNTLQIKNTTKTKIKILILENTREIKKLTTKHNKRKKK